MTVVNLLTEYYDWLTRLFADVESHGDSGPDGEFCPGFGLPELDHRMRTFLAPAEAAWVGLGDYRGHRLTLLDLARNPRTHTTKTLASLLIVARAVSFIRRTGEPVVIFSPTSANKGVALRDAVWRAFESGLVTDDQLRVAILAPAGCRAKLRDDALSGDRRHPVFLFSGSNPEEVKPLGRSFAQASAARVLAATGFHLWYTLDLRNYLAADTTRALFEHQVAPPETAERPRIHAHAVSSAFGLLGYHHGRAMLERTGSAGIRHRPASLLVQHLGTPDMVLSLRHGGFDRAALPAYTQASDGQLVQGSDPHFPFVAGALDEVLDPTFYTRQPVTSAEMNGIIERFGGDGIVVSLAECLTRYPRLSEELDQAGARPLPDDPRDLAEWSLAMAYTGVVEAIDRKLVEPGADVVIHGSGWYSTSDYAPAPESSMIPVSGPDDIAAALLQPDARLRAVGVGPRGR